MAFSQVKRLCSACWLFTASDMIMMFSPNVICGLFLPYATNIFQERLTMAAAIERSPQVIAWVWFHLLYFNISNQSRQESVKEDLHNKPWRPLPSGLITPAEARWLLLGCQAISTAVSLRFGGVWASLAVQCLTCWYNDLGGGDIWYLRNLLNAGGFLAFLTGAIQAAKGTHTLEMHADGILWYMLIFAVIGLTIQVQDLYDQQGDALIGRQTIPLVFGDRAARWSLAMPVLLFSLSVPAALRLQLTGYLIPLVPGLQIAIRTLMNSEASIKVDKTNAKLWSVWLICLYLLPILSKRGGSTEA